MSHRNVQPHVSIREVSCYRAERRHWMVVLPTPPSKEVGAPHQPPRVDQKQSGRGFCRTVECTFKVSPCVLLELSWVGKILSGQYQVPCHNQESLESLGVIGLCQHVSRNEVACYRTERTLMGCADPPSADGVRRTAAVHVKAAGSSGTAHKLWGSLINTS